MALFIDGFSTNAAGNKVIIDLTVGSAPIDSINLASGPTAGAITVTINGTARTITGYTLEAADKVGLTLASPVYASDTITITGNTLEPLITDADEAGLSPFATTSVTNISTLREPIVELIGRDLLTDLDTVDAGATYTYTLTVEWADNEASNLGHLKAIVAQGDAEEREDGPVGYRSWDQPYVIAIQYQTIETDTTLARTALNRIYADVYRALMADATRGGYAIDTRIDPPLLLPDGVIVTVTVHYRHLQDNPTSQS